jgi:hypothetical protein
MNEVDPFSITISGLMHLLNACLISFRGSLSNYQMEHYITHIFQVCLDIDLSINHQIVTDKVLVNNLKLEQSTMTLRDPFFVCLLAVNELMDALYSIILVARILASLDLAKPAT